MITDRAADAFFFLSSGPPPSNQRENILRPRPQVTPPPLSRLRLLPLFNSHPLDLIMSVIVATGMSDA